MVRDATSSIGKATDPDVGPGYAKVEIPGVNDLPGLQTACTDAIYSDLIAKHCATSKTPVQRVTVTWDANGSFVSEGGPTGSDEPIPCP
jgi:hypothetical protein